MSEFSGKPILIDEDRKPDAGLIARLKKARIAKPVQFVTNGQLAIEYLSGEGDYSGRARYPSPVLMLLEQKLPKRDGFEVLECTRQQEGLERLPVVVLTSSTRSPYITRAHDMGANSYLVTGRKRRVGRNVSPTRYLLARTNPGLIDQGVGTAHKDG